MRILTLLGAALVGYGLLPGFVQAQVVVQYRRPYLPPVIVAQPVRPVYYVTPQAVAPPITYSSSYAPSYSFYPQSTVYSAPVVSYYAPPVYTYSAPPVFSYSAPATVVTPGVVETRSYYGYGIFRPRGYYNETRYYP